uniref:Superoxide dismutase copper chaperone n=1 Tax=Pipistrellus kuhlii TaxID=59472 RepID=A0A7J7RZQ0_PIPKU|nr:copper chaperone for superoxide dismutase [Pipistrellus kuhlii]
MTCQSCVDAVRASLQGVAGVQSVEVQLENQMVLVQTTLPSQEVQALLEGTGRQAVLKGMGTGLLQNLGAAVAILGGPGPVQGVVRFLQLTPERCLIEGTIDGLEPGPHGLHVHQSGALLLLLQSESEGAGCAGVAVTFPRRSKVFRFPWSSVLSVSRVPWAWGTQPLWACPPLQGPALGFGAKQSWI